jgi:transposase
VVAAVWGALSPRGGDPNMPPSSTTVAEFKAAFLCGGGVVTTTDATYSDVLATSRRSVAAWAGAGPTPCQAEDAVAELGPVARGLCAANLIVRSADDGVRVKETLARVMRIVLKRTRHLRR